MISIFTIAATVQAQMTASSPAGPSSSPQMQADRQQDPGTAAAASDDEPFHMPEQGSIVPAVSIVR
ncbi:MAG TPA: hypothetical protein VLT16_15770, partial [Candidatus Limnocylindrales bacterium]|nr:hypothetical protein [Candidatus Limnocylindrales bacterium]